MGWKEIKTSYKGVGATFSLYWRAYGGKQAILTSPYFHISVVLTLLMYPFWSKVSDDPWWGTALSTLPNLLGFTLAGFTIWLGFGDEKFKELISGSTPEKTSVFMGVSAAFAHFVIIQIIALIFALWAKAMAFDLPEHCWLKSYIRPIALAGHAIGFLAFLYAIMSALAATLGVLRTASWLDQLKSKQKQAAQKASHPSS